MPSQPKQCKNRVVDSISIDVHRKSFPQVSSHTTIAARPGSTPCKILKSRSERQSIANRSEALLYWSTHFKCSGMIDRMRANSKYPHLAQCQINTDTRPASSLSAWRAADITGRIDLPQQRGKDVHQLRHIAGDRHQCASVRKRNSVTSWYEWPGVSTVLGKLE
jgi:hypothetical protein